MKPRAITMAPLGNMSRLQAVMLNAKPTAVRPMQRPMDFEDKVLVGFCALLLNLFALADYLGLIK